MKIGSGYYEYVMCMSSCHAWAIARLLWTYSAVLGQLYHRICDLVTHKAVSVGLCLPGPSDAFEFCQVIEIRTECVGVLQNNKPDQPYFFGMFVLRAPWHQITWLCKQVSAM